MLLPPIIGSKGLWFHSNTESSRSASCNKAVIGKYTVTSLRAKAPPSIETKTCLKTLFTQAKPLPESTRSIHTLFDLQRRRVDAAALALERLDKKHPHWC